jgi:hypothetical protein
LARIQKLEVESQNDSVYTDNTLCIQSVYTQYTLGIRSEHNTRRQEAGKKFRVHGSEFRMCQVSGVR